MKKTLSGLFAATLLAAAGTGCISTVDGGKSAGVPFRKDRIVSRYQLPVEQVFKRVRASVVAASHDLQTPWETSSLIGDFYFSKPGDVAPPMPGRVVKILVAKDARVKTGDPLLIIEAMKMEIPVITEDAGVVKELLVQPKDPVAEGQVVAILEG